MNETPDEEMKEHAETVMNELLGWYGYEKLNEIDSEALNLCLFPQSTNSATEPIGIIGCKNVNFQLATNSVSSSSVQSPSFRKLRANSEKVSSENFDLGRACRNSDENREVISSFPIPESDEQRLFCDWCKKIKKSGNFPFRTKNGNEVFCSESCFTHYGRPNLKQNKICDWCRHVRHTLTYVDFDDGDGQYQFCSDKCLNQFKLDIFCQETKEHLEIHPHHCDQLKDTRNTSLSSLITPDLWLRNCTPSTPASENPAPSTRKTSFPSSKHFSLTPQTMKNKESSVLVKISPAGANPCTVSEDEGITANITNEIFTSSAQLLNDQLQNNTNPESTYATKFSSTMPNSPISSVPSSKSEGLPANILSNMTRAANNHERYQTTSQNKPFSLNSRIPPLLPLISCKRHSSTETSVSSSSVIAATQAASIITKSPFPSPTLLVPYPVILPLPIPFPIPIPLPIVVNEAKKENGTNDTKCEDMRSNSISPNPVDNNDSIDSAWSLSSPSRSSPGSNDIQPFYDHTYENKIKKFRKN